MQYDIKYILNLKPTEVKSFSQRIIDNNITYFVTLERTLFFCVKCHSKLYIKDYKDKVIHHQIIRDKNTKIVYHARRYYCKTCNKTFYEENKLSYDSYSLPTILAIMRFLKEKSSTFAMASRQFNIPAPSIVNLFDKFVRMPTKAYPRIMMIDEFYAFRKQTKNKKYCCLLMDFETNNVIDIIEGRNINAWHRYIQSNHNNNRLNTSYICIDMFETYRHIQRIYFPSAILVCDSFHVIKNINKILIDERNKTLRKCEKGSINYYLLKKFRWLLTQKGDSYTFDVNNEKKFNRKLNIYANYYDLREMILKIDESLTEAYYLKEDYLYFNSYSTHEKALVDLDEIIEKFLESNIASFRKLSNTLINWHDEIVNSFILINGKRISNGKIESTNSIIKTILKNANGFTNFQRLRNKVMFVLDKKIEITLIKHKFKIQNKGKQRGTYKK